MRPRPTHLTDSHPGTTTRPRFGIVALASVCLAVMAAAAGGIRGPAPAGAAERVINHFNEATGEILSDVTLSEAHISPPDSCQFPGDGIKDFTEIHYRVIWPDTVSVGILIGVDDTDLGVIQSYKPRGPGETVNVIFTGCVYQNNVGHPLPDGQYRVRIRAIATGPDENFYLPLEIDRVPPIVSSLTVTSGSVFRNGETIVLELAADRPSYTIVPDFSLVDSNLDPTLTTVVDHGDGSYTIRHEISAANTAPDRQNVGIPIQITDLAGNTRTDRSARVCLLNHPPRLVSSRIVGTGNVFKNGDTLRVETGWEGSNGPLTVSADFGNIDDHYQSNLVSISELSNNVFELTYPLSLQNTKIDHPDYRLRVTVHDAGCGTATDTSIVLQLDNTPPPRPSLDPVPTTTRQTAVSITGTAPGAARVEVKRNNATIASAAPGADARFTAAVPLAAALNTLVVTALDPVGNRSAPDTVRVRLDVPASPQVDAVPATTRASTVTITGQVSNAVAVRVLRGATTLGTDSTLVNNRFEITVPLVGGNNDLSVEALNSLSESSLPAPVSIFRISTAFVSVPGRFLPGSGAVTGEFQLALASTGRSVRIELWNLAGDLISVLEDQTSRDLYTLSWDGRDSGGRPVQGGPLVSKIDITYLNGSKETVAKAFVLVKQ